jgi:para-aminobenzoate synthetase/4-amino-4-deoxychorismate lyase
MSLYPFSENDLKKCFARLESPFVFLETAYFDKENQHSFLFDSFVDVITFSPSDSVDLFFRKLDRILDKGYWLCGFFSYEFGYYLESYFSSFRKFCLDYPLVWLGVSKGPKIINHKEYLPIFNIKESSNYRVKNIKANITPQEYNAAIKKIKEYLERGDTYQVNFTFKLKFDFEGDALDFYLNLRRAQPTSYMAFINTGKALFLSLSPELFFRITAGTITTRPMKGTLRRGRFIEEDEEIKLACQRDKKIRAENLMIVDLLRNDLGRIAERGTVRVKDLFRLERYRTLYQMTSTIEAILRGKVGLKDIFCSLFPSGSVTGAPKIRTMQIIKELEKEERGIYTGTIGYISPQREACFNVAIRTVALKDAKGEMGIGGGIVYDSIDKKEYREANLKAYFLTKKYACFSLIETIRWQNRYFLIDLHMRRLKKSCAYFGIPLDLAEIEEKLSQLEKVFTKDIAYKVRLVLNMEGRLTVEYSLLEELKPPLKVKISSKRIDPQNTYLYHKTTNRGFYDEERKVAQREGFFEVIFANRYNQLTEGSITNIFLLINQRLYTPPLRCGLLPGILRESLLKENRAVEKVLFLEDIYKAEKVFLGNSIRGLLEVEVFASRTEALSKVV